MKFNKGDRVQCLYKWKTVTGVIINVDELANVVDIQLDKVKLIVTRGIKDIILRKSLKNKGKAPKTPESKYKIGAKVRCIFDEKRVGRIYAIDYERGVISFRANNGETWNRYDYDVAPVSSSHELTDIFK